MITIISIGKKYDQPQPCDIHLDATEWPTPPPGHRKADGRHPAIQTSVLTRNPIIFEHLLLTAQFAQRLAQEQDQVTVVIECSEGIHRSVAGAEALLAYVTELGEEATVFHRDLGRRSA
ncbi:RNase adapter RapZ [Corynebacterium glyciniphilum]|uniref:RapZ C-terminal domain-containing protein n=1 Tax=Corynebacterium TaxID=1716 RepID=UPI002653353D|nr:RNase adapter RapZ [Corynebacterium glyciniphilum]MDN6707025.1 RNase adapter RapZ [Corynebacterium glyciniphilum]